MFSKDSYQFVHVHSLISLSCLAEETKDPQLSKEHGDAQADLSLHWVHIEG